MTPDKRRQNEVLEAGLKGGAMAAMPGIVMGAVAENIHSAPRVLHKLSNKWLTGAVSAAGLGAAAMHKAKQVGMSGKETAGLVAGSGGGDAIGGYGGMLVGEELGRAATRSIHNPALRIAASIGGAIAGDTAGGVAGNIAGGKIAKTLQGHMNKTAMNMNAPLSELKAMPAAARRIFNMDTPKGPAVINTGKQILHWHPNTAINPHTIAAKKQILSAA